MCPGHAGEAAALTRERLARAAESNPDGWAAIVGASQMIDRPAPTWELRRRLRATLDRADPGWPAPDHPGFAAFVAELGADADLVVALAADGDGDGLGDWLSGDWDRDSQLREWLANLLPRLAHAGLTERVVEVGDALARLDPPEAPGIAADVAQSLALAGRRDGAVARVAAVLDAFGDQCWAQLRAGDVYVALDEPATAEDHYRLACAVAAQGGDPAEVSDAYEHLAEFLHRQHGRGADARAARAELAEWNRRHGWISATLTPAAAATDTAPAPQLPEPAAAPAPERRVKVAATTRAPAAAAASTSAAVVIAPDPCRAPLASRGRRSPLASFGSA